MSGDGVRLEQNRFLVNGLKARLAERPKQRDQDSETGNSKVFCQKKMRYQQRVRFQLRLFYQKSLNVGLVGGIQIETGRALQGKTVENDRRV